MKQLIEVDIFEETDFFEKYNKKIVARDLIDHIIKYASLYEANEYKIVINKKGNFACQEYLEAGFKREYQYNLKVNLRNNYLQIIYLTIGIVMLIISRLIQASSIFDEIFLIGAWVLIWETISIEVFNDSKNRKRRKILKKLAHAEIIEKIVK